MINLYDHQLEAIEKLKPGSILCGGVGSGKSRTAIAFYFTKICGGRAKVNGKGIFEKMKKPKHLYIITTAKKRDSLEWDKECVPFLISKTNHDGPKLIVDSWNNISKYCDVSNAFFIFDEQRLVGSGNWVKSFYKIAKKNEWILLSATPGDTWSDYIPVFVANGFYKNKTEFLRIHAVYNRYSKFPKIDKYIETSRLDKHLKSILVLMPYARHTKSHNKTITTRYNKELFDDVLIKRWNPYEDKPIKSISELCYLMRKVVNSDESRTSELLRLIQKHPKVIIFYNFDYELEILRDFCSVNNFTYSEWNGHKHEQIVYGDSWIYLVQYTSGAEGWNCIETDTIIFYSQNYSYKIVTQSAGRIDRMNTKFVDLYYYHFRSDAIIDLSIAKALRNKKDFNINRFMDI